MLKQLSTDSFKGYTFVSQFDSWESSKSYLNEIQYLLKILLK